MFAIIIFGQHVLGIADATINISIFEQNFYNNKIIA